EFKERNRDKAIKVKALTGKAQDLEHSRSQWKKKCEEHAQENQRLVGELAARDALIETEKELRQQEAQMYAEELEQLKKKWQMLQQSFQEKKIKKFPTDIIQQYLS
ncbi:MAG: hypothetical protein ACREGC_04525, partial [Minisyncoccia bacterium]